MKRLSVNYVRSFDKTDGHVIVSGLCNKKPRIRSVAEAEEERFFAGGKMAVAYECRECGYSTWHCEEVVRVQ